MATVQFSINNVVCKTTGKIPSELLFGYNPCHEIDASLLNESDENSRPNNIIEKHRRQAEKKMVVVTCWHGAQFVD